MLQELYDIITGVYKDMNREFEIPLSDISEETELGSLGIDSLTFVMIMLKIEEHYKIDIASQTDICYNSVGDVIKAINDRLS